MNDPAALATAYLGSLTLGAGQFCTNPGFLIVVKGPTTDAFLEAVRSQLPQIGPQTMLTTDICRAYSTAVREMRGKRGVKLLAESTADPAFASVQAKASVFQIDVRDYVGNPWVYQDEMFGASGVVVVVEMFEVVRVAKTFAGQLTASVFYGDRDDQTVLAELLPYLDRLCGRTVHNGWPTGVRVCESMVHGGPWPSTATQDTSVGGGAVRRFQKERCWQNAGDRFLPFELRDTTAGLPRIVNGVLTTYAITR